MIFVFAPTVEIELKKCPSLVIIILSMSSEVLNNKDKIQTNKMFQRINDFVSCFEMGGLNTNLLHQLNIKKKHRYGKQ